MFLLAFIKTLFASIFKISFYKDLKNTKLKSVILFFISSFLLLGVWMSTEIIVREADSLQESYEKTLSELQEKYPTPAQEDFSSFSDVKYLVPLALAPMYTTLAFFSTLLDAFLAYLIISSFSKKFSFKYIFKISLHLAVIAGIVERLGSSIYMDANYPLFSLSFWVLFIYVFWNLFFYFKKT